MRRFILISLIAVAIPTAIALAAPEGKYKGKVIDDSGVVTFKVEGHKVKNFSIDSVGATCPSGFTTITVFVPSARIKDDGTFRRRYRPVEGIDQKLTLKGSFDGRKANGIIKGGPLCVFKEEWKAKHR